MKESFALVTGLHWGGVVFYVAASIAVLYASFFQNGKWEKYGYIIGLPGVALHTGGLLLIWKMAGHAPYLNRFEVVSAYAWSTVAGFYVFGLIYPKIRSAAPLIFPLTFIMVAISLFLSPEIKQLPPGFRGIWLVLHILFYKIAFSAIMIALAFSVFFLLKKRNRLQRFTGLPDLDTLDMYAYRFAGFGFVFWAIGMVAGSIWAFNSWNIFWNWDPVQTWSLIAWGCFGLYLHLRRFFGWSGEKAAWLFTVCFATVLVSLFVTPVIESSIHSAYFK